MNEINWDMVGAMTGIMSFIMAIIGGLILAATKSIFVTKKEFKEHRIQIEQLENQFNKKLYDNKGITNFLPRTEYEKDEVERKDKCLAEHIKIWKELKEITVDLVRRPEWEQSKDDRERRRDASQRSLCGKIDKVTTSIDNMRNEQGKTNESLNTLIGSFKTYTDLAKKKLNDV